MAKSTLATSNYQFNNVKVTGKVITTIEDKNANESGIKIFPNPVTEDVNIVFPLQSENNIVEVSDFSAKTVAEFKTSLVESSASFNMKDLPRGIYFIRVNSDGNLSTKTVVKK